MKQILFRAISAEPETEGQFIYGSIVNLSKADKKPFYKMRDPDGNYSKVKQGTISQYTGVTDAQGIPIFEGDIIQSPTAVQWTIPELTINIQDQWKIIGNVHK